MAAVVDEGDHGTAISAAKLGHDDSRVDVVDVAVLRSAWTEGGGAAVGPHVGLAARQPQLGRRHALQRLARRGQRRLLDRLQVVGVGFAHSGQDTGFRSSVGVGAGPHLIGARHAGRRRCSDSKIS